MRTFRQAGAVGELTNGEDINQAGTPIDTPTGAPSNTSTNTPSGLRVRHLQDGLVIGEHDSNEPCGLCRGSGDDRGSTSGSSNGHIEHATI